ncbi:LacI family DNA-binding transcriptional regulator [Ideonella sp.]|uniref:LacI family DNA-binding transcriptional regulator n=1 Tax=Ideonella sp. TaxID=1929293 RepID=UPI003BB5EF1D
MADKAVTIRELAQAAQVSIGTVSRALKGQAGLSEQTRASVLRVAQELGYNLDKLRTGKPRRILFLYNRRIDSLTTNPFYSVVLHGAESACREEGVSLSLLSVAAGDDIAAQVRRHEPDGLIGMGYFEPETMAALQSCELPLVLTDHFRPGLRCINDDNLEGALQATRHLLDGGARRPAMIIGPVLHHSVALRVKGFRRALFEAGLLADPELEVTLDDSLPYDEAGREAMQRLLALPQPPDAVFAYNDETALHAMTVCHEAGLRIPQDLRLIGYDDIAAAARSKPPLSTVRVDKEALGRLVVTALVEGTVGGGDTLLPVELIVRESSRAVAAEAARPPRTAQGRAM